MDQRRFDSLTRSLAAPKTRRGLIGTLVALAAGVRAASAQPDCSIPGQTRNAKGRCACPAGTDPCPDGCVDKKRDPSNCGACGNACPADATCVKGKCVCPATGCTTTTTTTTAPGCTTAADCPPPTGVTCSFATCTGGVCGFGPYLNGTVCRAAAGPCDFAETCNGSSLDCPSDRFAAQGVACCPGGGSCQTFSACTGASPDCPPLEP